MDAEEQAKSAAHNRKEASHAGEPVEPVKRHELGVAGDV